MLYHLGDVFAAVQPHILDTVELFAVTESAPCAVSPPYLYCIILVFNTVYFDFIFSDLFQDNCSMQCLTF